MYDKVPHRWALRTDPKELEELGVCFANNMILAFKSVIEGPHVKPLIMADCSKSVPSIHHYNITTKLLSS